MTASSAASNALALRFTAHLPGVSSSIGGTGKLVTFKQNLALVAQGPLPAEQQAMQRQAFINRQQDWLRLI